MKALLLAALAACATNAAGGELLPVVRVGLDPRSAPWAFVPGRDYEKEDVRAPPNLTSDEISRLAGLDVDVLRCLARRMRVRTEVVQTPWLDLEQGLLGGRYDIILNAWTPNPKMPAGIAASDPYYEWGLLIASRAADRSIRSVADLAGRRIGHVSDPSVLPALRALGAGIGAKLFVLDQGGEELFANLGRNEIDAVVFDSAYVRWRVARDGAFRVVGEPLNHLGYHVGVRAADQALFEKAQAAVKAFVASPEAAEIRNKWESAGTPAP